MNSRPQEYHEKKCPENDFERLLRAAVLKILQETSTTTMDMDLNPSHLGTRDYWEETYSAELQNYEESNGVDVGEIWFGFESERRICNWIARKALGKQTSIVDIGSGNGSMLLALHKTGYTNLTGVDYSPAATSLAGAVARDKGAGMVSYFCADITTPLENQNECPQIFGRKFEVCIDKGTYDAICLSPENSRTKRMLYAKNVSQILSENGILIITSCNWTKDELVAQFTELELVDELPSPQIQFGGKSGRTVTALIFKHIAKH